MIKKNIAVLSALVAFVFTPLAYCTLPLEKETIRVFKRIAPFVVNVHRVRSISRFFGPRQELKTGQGSGYIWNSKGYIVTNYHVVREASRLAVTFNDGQTVQARLVGVAPRDDLAVIKLKSNWPLRGLNFKNNKKGRSSALAVGQLAIAIGNPYGLTQTLTEGVVSALGREIQGPAGVNIMNMVQTDASINPGNSGGPLLDSAGRLIGLNNMIFSRSGGSMGIGFAIPIDTVKKVVTEIIDHGRVTQPGIGVIPVDSMIAMQSGIHGLIIQKVVPRSPAAKAGLKGLEQSYDGQVYVNDIIVGVDGKKVNHFNDFYKVVIQKGVGKTIELKVKKGHRVRSLSIKIADIG